MITNLSRSARIAALMKVIATMCLLILVGAACTRPAPVAPMQQASPSAGGGQQDDDDGQDVDLPSNNTIEREDQPPASGGLETFVRKDIGDFSLVDSSRAEPFITNLGAIDALNLTYEDSHGNQIGHIMAAFKEPEAALDSLNAIGNALIERSGYELDKEGELTGSDGNQVGVIAALKGEDAVVLWTIGNVFLSAESSDGSVVEAFLMAFFGR